LEYSFDIAGRISSERPLKRSIHNSPAIDTNPATALQILLLLECVVTPNTIAARDTAENPMAIKSRYLALDQAEQKSSISFEHCLGGKFLHP